VEERDALVVVGAFTGMDEAAVARGALEQEGIETFLANEHMVTLVWTLSQATSSEGRSRSGHAGGECC